jgi:hypothetical protein
MRMSAQRMFPGMRDGGLVVEGQLGKAGVGEGVGEGVGFEDEFLGLGEMDRMG